MKIGVISDTHDDLRHLDAALGALRAEGVTTILHCGDLCGPDVLQRLSGFEVWAAQGNMDCHPELAAVAEEALGRGRLARLHTPALDGCSIAVTHGNQQEVLASLIVSGAYAYVFHGHTHRRRDQWVGRTRVINPGALGGTRWQSRSFCIVDLETGGRRFVEVE